MAIIAKGVLSSRIREIGKTKDAMRNDIQEVLVSVAYQAFMGNPNHANELLDEVKDTVVISGITRWLEIHAPLRVKKGLFVINKAALKKAHVVDESTFAPLEAEMVKVKWWELGKAQKAESIFESASYISDAFKRMVAQLNKHGAPDLANEVASLEKLLYSTNSYKTAVGAKG